MNIYKPFLDELRARYKKGEVSALIGAGFSKNLHHSFPDWDELLRKMSYELFAHELPSTPSESEFTKELAEKYIAKHGHLNIVSQFIKKNGFRECIDLYIEEHIPYLDLKEEKLIYKDKSIEIKEENTAVHRSLLSLDKLISIYTTNYDNILEEVADRTEWDLITSSYDLKMSALKKPIIKIHGDIRRTPDGDFCFDGDHTKRYVISQEDYDQYAVKHEAFMQLMRISLLRESLMVFGFSGDDPNFTAWIRWVRDILIKAPNTTKDISSPEYYKIFLFSVDTQDPSPAKQQFYINHRIKYIPLLNQEYLSLLGLQDENNIQQIITKTLKYCATSYEELWKLAAEKKGISIPQDHNIFQYYIDQIREEKSNNRLIADTLAQEMHIEDSFHWKEIHEEYANLLVLAFHDTKYPIDIFDSSKVIESALRKKEYLSLYFELLNRFKTLTHNYSSEDEMGVLGSLSEEEDYNIILKAQFSLDFDLLKKYLNQWHPRSYRLLNKAILYALYDAKQSYQWIDQYEVTANRQEQINAICIKFILNRTWCTYMPKEEWMKLKLPLAKWERLGLTDIYTVKDKLLERHNEHADLADSATVPYGYERKTYKYGFGDHRVYLSALQLFQHLLDSGLMAYQYLTAEQWYSIAKELYSFYPYPVLWHTLSYHNNDLLTKIAQDYAYSDELQEDMPPILCKLLTAYISPTTPHQFKESIAVFAQPLFSCVALEHWQTLFIDIWFEAYIKQLNVTNSSKRLQCLIDSGLKYITDQNSIWRIIESCIDHIDDHKELMTGNVWRLKHCVDGHIPASLEEKIVQLIQRTADEDYYSILRALRGILSEESVLQIKDSLYHYIDNTPTIDNDTLLHLVYFAKFEPIEAVLCDRLKDIILEHPVLWDNGKVNGAYRDPRFIHLYQIDLSWSDKELLTIMRKASRSFSDISGQIRVWSKNPEGFIVTDYRAYLESIHFFFKSNIRLVASLDSNEKDIVQSIFRIYIEYRGYTSIQSGLLSSNTYTVIAAASEFIFNVSSNWSDEHIIHIYTIIDLAHTNSKGLSKLLNAICELLKHRYEMLNQNMIIKIQNLLSFRQDTDWGTLNVEKNVIYEYLVTIAEILNSHAEYSSGVTYWLSQKGRFIYNYGKPLI